MFLITALISLSTFAQTESIALWKETPGITEQQALTMARKAIQQDIAIDEDGQICGVEEIWGWEREADLVADFPQERGEIFAIHGYVKGPHVQMGCASTQSYDCRIVFNRPTPQTSWRVEYTECESTGLVGGGQD